MLFFFLLKKNGVADSFGVVFLFTFVPLKHQI